MNHQTCDLIFQLIYQNKGNGIRRQDIARYLNLSLPTVGTHLKRLQKQNLICEMPEKKSSRTGRRSNLIFPNSQYRYSLGLEITRTKVKFLLMDFCQNVLNRRDEAITFSSEISYQSLLAEKVEQFIEESQISRKKILGIGIAITAVISNDSPSRLHSYILNINSWSPENFSSYLPYPYMLQQIASAALSANIEKQQEKTPLAYIWIGEVLAAAAVFQRDVYHGNHSLCMEINHFCMIPNGKLHNCGKRGCLGAYCSSVQLTESFDGSLEVFFRELDHNNPAALEIWSQYTDILAQALNNLYLIVDCDIMLGGPVGSRLARYLPELQKKASSFNPHPNAAEYLLIDPLEESTMVGSAQSIILQYIYSGLDLEQ